MDLLRTTVLLEVLSRAMSGIYMRLLWAITLYVGSGRSNDDQCGGTQIMGNLVKTYAHFINENFN